MLEVGKKYLAKNINGDYAKILEIDKDSVTFNLNDTLKLTMSEKKFLDRFTTEYTQHEPKKSGTKHDSGKPRVSLIPKAALLGMARALSYGEKKYGTHNFRNGLSYSRLADACMRHLSSWMEGETLDPESGLSHMDHAIASLAMLKFMEEHRADMDDRWLDPQFNPEEQLSDEAKQEVAEEIQKRGR
jgi:dATP/dGTP diphosphohydrolase